MAITEAQRQATLENYKKTGAIPPARILDQRGRGMNNPLYQVVSTYISQQQAAASFAKSGITLQNVGGLDRTTSNIVQGKTSRKTKLNPEQKYMLAVYDLNTEARSGSLSADQYNQRLSQIKETSQQETRQRTLRFAETAAISGRSETAKQDEARAIAAQQGVAVGTIGSGGMASVSANSIEFKNQQVSEFVNAQKNLMSQQAQTYEQVKPKNVVVGTTTEPLKGSQPDQSLVSPFLKSPNYNYTVSLSESLGPRQPLLYNVSLTESLGKFQGERISAKREPGNILQNFGASLYDATRYYDLVANKEAKEPTGLKLLPYYASKGLSVIYNIPLNLMGDKKTTPTLFDTVFDTGYQLVTTGRTKTHDPIGNYIRKDPVGTIVQVPGEAALWVVGAKAFSAAKKYSPLQYESKKILTNEGKTQAIIKSITVSGKPILSIQRGKLVKGFDPLKIAYEKINVNTREGFEAALGSGIEKEIFYSQKALSSQVSRGIIPEIGATRSRAWVKAVEQAKGIVSKGGTIGANPIDGLTVKQTTHIFDITKKEQGKTIDLLHGSIATRTSIPEIIQKEAGSALKMGDIDITPKGKPNQLPRISDELVQKYARGFPLEPGQRLKILNLRGNDNANRALVLTEGKEEKKILEVVLRKSDESKYGIGKGDKILNIRIPFTKSVKVKDWGLKVHTADYQLLTNVKQVLSYQKGKETPFDIYTSSGRTKDIVRGYWNLKGKAVFASSKSLDEKAEYIRSLYPKLEFTDVKPEKILLYSSRTGSSESGSLSKVVFQTPKSITGESKFDDDYNTNKPSIKESTQSSSTKENIRENLLYAKPQSMSRDNSRSPYSDRLSVAKYSTLGSSKYVNRTNSVWGSRGSNKPDSSNVFVTPSKGSGFVKPETSKGSTIFEKPDSKIPTSIVTKTPTSITGEGGFTGGGSTTTLTGRTQNKTTLSFTRRKIVVPVIFDIKNTTKKNPGIYSTPEDFIGNTSITDITSFRTKKKDIDLGITKTSKLYSKQLGKEFGSWKKSNKNMFKKSKSKLSLV